MTVLALDLRTRAMDTLLKNTAIAWYLPTGHLVSVRPDGSVVGSRFDPRSLKITGAPVPLLTGVQLDYRGIIDIVDATSKTVQELQRLNLSAGVDIDPALAQQ